MDYENILYSRYECQIHGPSTITCRAPSIRARTDSIYFSDDFGGVAGGDMGLSRGFRFPRPELTTGAGYASNKSTGIRPHLQLNRSEVNPDSIPAYPYRMPAVMGLLVQSQRRELRRRLAYREGCIAYLDIGSVRIGRSTLHELC